MVRAAAYIMLPSRNGFEVPTHNQLQSEEDKQG